MNANELRRIWADLGDVDARSEGLDRRRLIVESALDMFACILWPERRPGLLIEAPAGFHIEEGRLPTCRGLHFTLGPASGAGHGPTLIVQLDAADLEDVFAVLGADLVTSAAREDNAQVGLKRCLDRIAMWRGLLEQLPVDGLDDAAQRGLFGELHVLRAIFLEGCGAYTAVTSWDGPGRAFQDFVTGSVAVEVKTSLAKRHARLTITSERQLDETPFEALYLAHVSIAESTAGATLVDLVADLRDRLSGDHATRSEFDARLLGAGYLDRHEDHYKDARYVVERLRAFDVRDAFPRLTGAMLPPGVGDLTYTIVADDIGAYEVDLETVAARVGALHG